MLQKIIICVWRQINDYLLLFIIKRYQKSALQIVLGYSCFLQKLLETPTFRGKDDKSIE